MFKMWLIINLAVLLGGFAQASKTSCKCLPTQSCWPSQSDWESFNQTVEGRLIQSKPPASVCYTSQPDYNAKACEYVSANWFNSSWHAANPVSIDYPGWANDSCNPIFPNGTSITGNPNAGAQGCSNRYPFYVVNATKAIHVEAAINWARTKNIRLNVKSTGHNFLGRSTGYGSLSIWTHNMRGIEYIESFAPSDCKDCKPQKAARIAAGEQCNDVYTELDNHKAVSVCGSNPTVGIVGWMTGGGHGPATTTYGLGADNVLEMTVVTPAGKTVIANSCKNSDLFYAIRGGGGSTFGVVLEVVMKAYSTPKTSRVIATVGLTNLNSTTEWWKLMAVFHTMLPEMKAGGLQGYYGMVSPPLTPTYVFYVMFRCFDKPNGTIEALLTPFKNEMDKRKDLFQYNVTTDTQDSFLKGYGVEIGAETVATGGNGMGSWLLPPAALKDVDKLATTFEKLATKTNPFSNSPLLLGHFIAPGSPPDHIAGNNGLNDAWRTAITHFVVVQSWKDGLGRTEIDSIYKDTTVNKTDVLKTLAPDSGAYFNECDAYDPDWKKAGWGHKYARLSAIKKKHDPKGVFWCHNCVGSDEWVQKGDGSLCKASGYENRDL